MGKLIKYLIVAAFFSVLLLGASFAGAYFRVGELLGAPPPEMGPQKTRFAYDGVKTLRGKPIGWVFEWTQTKIPGAPGVQIVVSPTAKVLATQPADLAERVHAFHNRPY